MRWKLAFTEQVPAIEVARLIEQAAAGPHLETWAPPSWLLPHQVPAAQKLAACLDLFAGALLADAVGLGKTYVALGIATRYHRVTAVVPAALRGQWTRTAATLGIDLEIRTLEGLSRGGSIPRSDLVIVDEAHRLRNPDTRRYDRLARDVTGSHVLLVTATPVVNRPRDLVHLFRLFAGDQALAMFGVPSLERAIELRDARSIHFAATPLTVSRAVRQVAGVKDVIPRTIDGPVLRPKTIDEPLFGRVVDAIDVLEFPTAGDQRAGDLLRLHLFHRLASSAAACRETLRRHLAYLDRAIGAARRGEPLSRRAARYLFGFGDDLQLELSLAALAPAGLIDPDRLERERTQIVELLELVPESTTDNPKAAQLLSLLATRGTSKTLVFTVATATALDLAQQLGWRRLAVVAGGRVWIASGRISVDAALAAFAPNAQGAGPLNGRRAVSVLLATDLVSEGLDLQDADGVVHYDLPWTPLRLTQRIGRVARLGARHDSARVWWFAPPSRLESRLALAARISGKVSCQLETGVATTSAVGRAEVSSQAWYAKQLVMDHERSRPRAARPVHSVVRGPQAAVVAIRWITAGGSVPGILVLAGHPPQEICDSLLTGELVDALAHAPSSDLPPSPTLLSSLGKAIARRMSATQHSCTSSVAHHLSRTVIGHARVAGANRETGTIGLLNAVLNRIGHGLRAGAERRLPEALIEGPDELRAWLDMQAPPSGPATDVVIDAALFGDGTTDR